MGPCPVSRQYQIGELYDLRRNKVGDAFRDLSFIPSSKRRCIIDLLELA